MGKDLKGRELGVGIVQRKDGWYTARFTDKRGKRRQKYFKKIQECRRWLADTQYLDEHSDVAAADEITVDSWFEYFIKYIKTDTVRPNTVRNYKERYYNNVSEHIGKLYLSQVKPLHCQHVLNQMVNDYRDSTIYQVRTAMYSIFQAAVDNDILIKNPMKRSVKCPIGKPVKQMRVLTIEEQKLFLNAAYGTCNYYQFAFLLQTGMRTGEMIGLKWSDIDFEKGIISIRRTMEYRYSAQEWRIGPPKTKSSNRDIPMTEECRRILKAQRNKDKEIKVTNSEYKDFVFLCKKGEPKKSSSYDTSIYKIVDKVGMDRFSMHTFRHTYATRCIEAGMRPKTLQMLLGHSKLSMTMDLYVHVTDDEKKKEIEKIEDMLIVV